jgi:hypothetical protein
MTLSVHAPKKAPKSMYSGNKRLEDRMMYGTRRPKLFVDEVTLRFRALRRKGLSEIFKRIGYKAAALLPN